MSQRTRDAIGIMLSISFLLLSIALSFSAVAMFNLDHRNAAYLGSQSIPRVEPTATATLTPTPVLETPTPIIGIVVVVTETPTPIPTIPPVKATSEAIIQATATAAAYVPECDGSQREGTICRKPRATYTPVPTSTPFPACDSPMADSGDRCQVGGSWYPPTPTVEVTVS